MHTSVPSSWNPWYVSPSTGFSGLSKRCVACKKLKLAVMTNFMRSIGSFENAAAFIYVGEWIDMVATIYRIDSGDIQNIGKLTLPRLNLPEKIVRPIYFTTSLNAVRYRLRTKGSISGKPPSLWASGYLQSSVLFTVWKFLASSRISILFLTISD